jgi:hypothetical protein
MSLFTAVRAGEPWPDLNDAVIGHNSAPVEDTDTAIRDRIEDLAREAERMLKAGAAPTRHLPIRHPISQTRSAN